MTTVQRTLPPDRLDYRAGQLEPCGTPGCQSFIDPEYVRGGICGSCRRDNGEHPDHGDRQR